MRRRFTTNKFLTKTFEINNYLTIEALENDLTVSFTFDIAYGIDGQGWMLLKAGRQTQSINAGQTLSFRGNLTPYSDKGVGTFTISKKCNLKGNCMSMLFGDDAADNFSLSGKDWAFCRLFYNCTNIVNVSSYFLPATTLASYCYEYMFGYCKNLTTAPVLPATTLASSCYDSMFTGCTGLTTAPELPATTLASYCYQSMFYNCSSLTTAPELPATTLAWYCYSNMFYGCKSLTTAPELPATTLAMRCYYDMFYNCSSLTTAPELPATTLANDCYQSMFSNCTSLTTAPELPATTLASSCYRSMFAGCTNLNYIKMLATDIPANKYCLKLWVTGVSSTGTFVKNPAMTTLPTGISGIPNGWTVVNDGEESGGSLTFPVTLYGTKLGFANEDLGIRVYNFIKDTKSHGDYLTESETIVINATDGSISETLYVRTIRMIPLDDNRICLVTDNSYWRCELTNDGVLMTDYD